MTFVRSKLVCLEIAYGGDFEGPSFGRPGPFPTTSGGHGGSGGGFVAQRYTDNSNPTDTSALNAIRRGAKWIRDRGKLKSDSRLEAEEPYNPTHARIWSPEEVKKLREKFPKPGIISKIKGLFKRSK